MAKLRGWPARWPRGDRAEVMQYTLAASQTFKSGAWVVKSSGAVQECGADPAAVLGMAMEDADSIEETGKVLVYTHADGDTVFAVQGTVDPVHATHVGNDYGVVKDGDGIWVIDISETTATVLHVVDVDVSRKLYFVTILAAKRQAL